MQHAQQLEDLAYGLGRRFAEERDRLQETSKALAAKIDAHKAAALLEIASAIAGVKNGEPGRDGEQGERGEKGDKGEPGETPELSNDLVAAVLDRTRELRLDLDEQMFAATKRFDRLSTECEERLANVKDGEPGPAGMPGPEGPAGADGATGEPRGKYDPAETYHKLDRVSFNGSEWIARKDAPGPLPGDGWMLGAMGKKGRPGVGIQNAVVRDYALVLEMTDGKAMTIDLRGMFERYDQERDA
jgi:integrin beta 3